MKDAVLLLLCAVALAQASNQNTDQGKRACNCDPSEAQQICQANIGTENVLIAHENCDRFYKCSNGKPLAQRCPTGLLYDPVIETCNWPNSVDCGDRPISDGNDSDESDCDNDDQDNGNEDDGDKGSCNCNPDEAPQICAAEGSEGTFIAHSNCNQFYMCAHGKPVAFPCGPGLLYNPYDEICDWAHKVECDDRVIPELDVDNDNDSSNEDENDNQGTCNCNPEEAPVICAAPNSDGTLIAHENCNKFYICTDGIPVPLSCPRNLLYNPYIEQCDWPTNVDCGDRIVPKPDFCPACPESDESDDIDNLPPAGDDAGSDSADIDDLPPAGDDAGSDSADIDDLPPAGDDAGSDSTENDSTCNCNPEEAPAICAAEDSSGTLIAHENCNQFYKCDRGLPVVFTCPPGLLYNPYKEVCDWPANVDCGDRVIPDPEESDESDYNGSTDIDDLPPAGDDTSNDNDNDGTCNCNPEEAPAICATEDSSGTLIAHENCNQFYKCDHGLPVVFTCPPGLLYNPYKELCDWPANVDCGDRVIPVPEESNESDNNDSSDTGGGGTPPGGNDSIGDNENDGTCNCNPEEAPVICAAEDSSGILIAHENCNQFYKCDHGLPVVFTCPPGLLYNPYKELCDWPANVDCGDRVIPDPEESDESNNNDSSDTGVGGIPPGDNDSGGDNENDGTCNCNPEEAPAICAAEDSSGTLIAHENCNQFYKCDHGLPVVFTCPPGLLYNPYKEVCDWPENVDCGDRVIPDPEESDESDYNDSSDIDDLPPAGDDTSNDNNNDGTCNCNPEEAPSICATEDSSGTLIAHENCNQFYKCDHGLPVVFTCPPGLLYNPYKEVCDWPANVDCGDRVIPDPEESNESDNNDSSDTGGGGTLPGGNDSIGDNENDGTCNCNPEEAPAICAAEDSSGILIAHENCNQFYKCDHGLPVVFTCPPGLLYNPYKELCDWPANVDCGDRVIPDPKESDESDNNDSSDIGGGGTPPGGNDSSGDNENDGTCNCNPEEAPAICAAEDSSGTLIAHENCNQFYKCDHGLPVVFTCPPGLLYNPYKQVCDWPANVDCGDRVIPDPEDDINESDTSDSSDIDDLPPAGDDASNEGNNDTDDNDSDCSDDNNSTEDDDTCNCKPDEAPSICAGSNSDGVLIAHENCNQFYLCSNGIPVALSCPKNLLYNPVLEVCDWPLNVECGDRIIPEPKPDGPNESDEVEDSDEDNISTCNCNPEEAQEICAADGSSGIQVAHENCNKFYICDHKRPVAITCLTGLLYNPYTEHCDWPDNVDCGNRTIPEPKDDEDSNNEDNDSDHDTIIDINDDPSQAPEICASTDSEGVLVAHEYCNHYYICSGGLPISRPCPEGLLYNPLIQQCDWPRNVDCGNRIIPDDNDDCACNPRNAPILCARPGSDGTLVAHENCNQFYMCVGKLPVTLSCPANLHYNIDKEYCDWPRNVDCGYRYVASASFNKHLESRKTIRN